MNQRSKLPGAFGYETNRLLTRWSDDVRRDEVYDTAGHALVLTSRRLLLLRGGALRVRAEEVRLTDVTAVRTELTPD